MSLYQEIADQLDAAKYFATVAVWVDPAIDSRKQIHRPAAIVFPLQENTVTHDRPGAVDEETRIEFVVMLSVSAKNDATGAASLGELEKAKQTARRQLRAFTPASASDIVKHKRGQLAGFGNGVGAWQQIYTTVTRERTS